MASTLEQIIAELNPTYEPQVNTIRQRQAAIPGMIAQEEKGLQAKQENAFGDILNGARRRGLGFSGIPLGEQAKYTSTEFLPALARLRQSGQEQATSLEDAINQIYERRNTLAQQLRQGGLDREEQQRQFNLNYQLQQQQAADARRAASASMAQPTLGGATPSSGSGVRAAQGPQITQRTDKGFDFFDENGRPITSRQYAQLKGINFLDLVNKMASSGDKASQQYLKSANTAARLKVQYGF